LDGKDPLICDRSARYFMPLKSRIGRRLAEIVAIAAASLPAAGA